VIRRLLLLTVFVSGTALARLSGGPASLAPTCRGPATPGGGPTTIGVCSSAAGTIPATVGADTNCATTAIPAANDLSTNGWNGFLLYVKGCPTGATAGGYTVTSVSAYIASATAGATLKCSVYTDGAPQAHVSAPCDSVEATLIANPNAYVTMVMTGACVLTPSTRYWIACATNSGATTFGRNATACAGCWSYMSTPYASLWPATLSPTAANNVSGAAYLTFGGTLPSTTTTTTLPPTGNLPTVVGADANCASGAAPVPDGQSVNGWSGYLSYGKTCATGAAAGGYTVTAVSAYITLASAGAHLKCSVYDNANAHVGAGCVTTEATLTANPNAYITMPTSGSCHLNPSVRYQIACATDSAATTFGQVGPTNSCIGCWNYMSVAYGSLWPATLTVQSTYNLTLALYLTLAP
jgi:hypothetical protein